MAKLILFIGRAMEISDHAMEILLNSWYDVSRQSELGQCKVVCSTIDARERKDLLMIIPKS